MFCNKNYIDFPLEVLATIAHDMMKLEFKDIRSALSFFKPNIGEKKVEITKEFDRTINSPNF